MPDFAVVAQHRAPEWAGRRVSGKGRAIRSGRDAAGHLSVEGGVLPIDRERWSRRVNRASERPGRRARGRANAAGCTHRRRIRPEPDHVK